MIVPGTLWKPGRCSGERKPTHPKPSPLVSRIALGAPAELIARNIPSAASMCYDAGANQLVIPMNPNNGLAFVPLP